MGQLWLNPVVISCVLASAVTTSWAQGSTRSAPKDVTPYSRSAIPADSAGPPAVIGAPGTLSLVKVINAVVNNTDPTLKNTDTFNDGETSIAINPANPNEIVLSA